MDETTKQNEGPAPLTPERIDYRHPFDPLSEGRVQVIANWPVVGSSLREEAMSMAQELIEKRAALLSSEEEAQRLRERNAFLEKVADQAVRLGELRITNTWGLEMARSSTDGLHLDRVPDLVAFLRERTQGPAPTPAMPTVEKSGPCVNCGEGWVSCAMREHGDCCNRCNHSTAERTQGGQGA